MKARIIFSLAMVFVLVGCATVNKKKSSEMFVPVQVDLSQISYSYARQPITVSLKVANPSFVHRMPINFDVPRSMSFPNQILKFQIGSALNTVSPLIWKQYFDINLRESNILPTIEIEIADVSSYHNLKIVSKGFLHPGFEHYLTTGINVTLLCRFIDPEGEVISEILSNKKCSYAGLQENFSQECSFGKIIGSAYNDLLYKFFSDRQIIADLDRFKATQQLASYPAYSAHETKKQTSAEKAEAKLREAAELKRAQRKAEVAPLRMKPAPLRMKPTQVSWRAPRKTRILSVGVGDFKDTAIPRIDYAESDARGFACLAKSSGIPEENISYLANKDAYRNAITDALIKLKMATTERSETAIFYFSGHGAPLIKNGKIVDAALVPYDARENSLEYTGIKISTLRELLSDTRGNWIVILDACFSGREGRSLMAKNIKGICVVPKDFTVAPKSTKNNWWITATSGDNFANDFPKENHGLFTYYFLKALNGEKNVDANEDGLISVKEAFNWTKKEVSAVSAKSLGRLQVPELIGKGDTILTIPR